MIFPLQLASTRRRLGLTQVELAAALEVTAQTLSNWECGRSTPWQKQQLVILARLLDLCQGETKPAPRALIIERIAQ